MSSHGSPAEESDEIDEDEKDEIDDSDKDEIEDSDSDDDIDMSLSSDSRESSLSESKSSASPFLTANIPTPCVAIDAIRTISPAVAASHLRAGVQSRTLWRAGFSELWGPVGTTEQLRICGSNGMR